MGRIPDDLKRNIAQNIRDCRIQKFPGRGGSKRCAEAFGVSPQQWSPWERGLRTPDEFRLARMADFFGVSVEWLRRDNREFAPQAVDSMSEQRNASTSQKPLDHGPITNGIGNAGPAAPELFSYLYHHKVKAVYRVEVMVTDAQYVPIHSPVQHLSE